MNHFLYLLPTAEMFWQPRIVMWSSCEKRSLNLSRKQQSPIRDFMLIFLAHASSALVVHSTSQCSSMKPATSTGFSLTRVKTKRQRCSLILSVGFSKQAIWSRVSGVTGIQVSCQRISSVFSKNATFSMSLPPATPRRKMATQSALWVC